MKKEYIDTGMKGNDEGTLKVMALKSCSCGGTGVMGYRNVSHKNKELTARNQPCYCGSGVKYKKCCGSKPKEQLGEPIACGCIMTTELDIEHITI